MPNDGFEIHAPVPAMCIGEPERHRYRLEGTLVESQLQSCPVGTSISIDLGELDSLVLALETLKR